MSIKGFNVNGSVEQYDFGSLDNTAGAVTSEMLDSTLSSAIESISTIGTRTTAGGSAVSVSTETWTDLANISHDAGTFLVIAHAQFAVNSTGNRFMRLTDSSGSSQVVDASAQDTRAAISGANTQMHNAYTVTASSSGTWYLTGYQNSGSTLTTYGYIQLIQLA